MNWLQKIVAQENIAHLSPGRRAILSTFGYRDFSVVQIIDQSQIEPSEYNNLSPHEGSVPFMIIDSYGEGYSKEESYTPGTVSTAISANLYPTLADLIKQQSRTLYPDLLLGILSSKHIGEFGQDYPDMTGFESIGEFVDYEQFEDESGYMIQVFQDPRAHVGFGREKAEFPYYWYIPELKVRSLDFRGKEHDPNMQEVIKVIWSNSGSFRYGTVQEASDAASKYIDYMLYQNS